MPQSIARDCFTGRRVARPAHGLICHRGEAFAHQVIYETPFLIAETRIDGGNEFQGAFHPSYGQIRLVHYFNRPDHPQGSGPMEWPFGTDDEDFCQADALAADIGVLEGDPPASSRVSETTRAHQAPGFGTMESFHGQTLTKALLFRVVMFDKA